MHEFLAQIRYSQSTEKNWYRYVKVPMANCRLWKQVTTSPFPLSFLEMRTASPHRSILVALRLHYDLNILCEIEKNQYRANNALKLLCFSYRTIALSPCRITTTLTDLSSYHYTAPSRINILNRHYAHFTSKYIPTSYLLPYLPNHL